MSRIVGPRRAEPLGPLDPRDNPWRKDLADISLADRVAVPNYVQPALLQAIGQVAVLTGPSADAPAASELLPGEEFALLDSRDGFGWGYSAHDRYVGFVALDALAPTIPVNAKAGRIGPGDALLFAAAAIKSPVVATFPMGAPVHWQEHDDRFVVLASGRWSGSFLHRQHLMTGPAADWVGLAERFVGAPYRWGGRSRTGVDCSGLVQVARMLAGHPCRRDSDMQFADAGTDIAPGEARRGDIAWWPGHIGVLVDSRHLLHANAFWMACIIEPLAEVEARAAASGGIGAARFRRP